VEAVATVTALLAVVLNTCAGALGAWRWWRVEPSDAFWRLTRVAQASSVLLAVTAGVLYLSGGRPDDDLFWLYAGLPAAVSFFAEQFRILSAQTVLDARGFESAQEVGERPEAEQRSVVLQIVRREIGVMTLAGFVCAFLALRAVTEVGGLSDSDSSASSPAPRGPTVVLVGDSLAKPLEPLLPREWDLVANTQNGRLLEEGMALLEREIPADRRAVLAMSLFTNNDPAAVDALERAVRRTVGLADCAVWATIVSPPSPNGTTFAGANRRLRALSQELAPDLQLVPWAETIRRRPELLRPDGVHGTEEGYRVRAALYADAVRRC
jgi:hypothetical protein